MLTDVGVIVYNEAMGKAKKAIRKTLALVIGLPILVLGIVLIPLPGPGFLITFLGLFILSLEFDMAAKHKNRIQDELKKIIDKAKEKSDSINK